ncbi:U-box domain-containing protein 4 [Nymphaea thermarum]|nr:U-box domain-containing protein 4 [Nymphaea thermarum]
MVSLSQDPACSAVELAKSQAPAARSMRTLRSKFVLHADLPPSEVFSLADSGDIDLTLLVASPSSFRDAHDFLDLSQAFSDFSACSSDISGELQRLASIPPGSDEADRESAASPEELELGLGFAEQPPEDEEEEILGFLESMDAEELEPTIRIFISALGSPSASAKRSAAGKIRLLAKNREENRELIGRTGAIPPLIGLLRCRDPVTQEYAATALLNLSLYDANRAAITAAGGIKPLVYALKTGTAVAKENSACALSSLAMVEENKSSIGAAGAVPALVALLIGGSARGKKDALTALYKLSSLRRNKELAVTAGAVKPLLDLISDRDSGVVEKAVVVLSSLGTLAEGKAAIVEEDGIPVLVEVIEDGTQKGKEFAVATLLGLCVDSVSNRTLLVREGGIPPLVALSQTGTPRAKAKVEN